MFDHGDASLVQLFGGNRPSDSAFEQVDPFPELKIGAVVVCAAVSSAKLAKKQVSCNLLGLLLLIEGSLEVNFSGTFLDPSDGSFKVNHCQVFQLGHCEMPRLKNLFRCGDFSLKTT